ncbi:MAG: hypothetical protein E5Y74_08410 [Mesorhizobium sp.]|nr:MAG: hypothetical protein E5Y74_08410 [Mesorhizobium sp.]
MKQSTAEILREYGPFADVERVHGVSFDGSNVWFASGEKLNAFDPENGQALRSIDVAAHAGTAWDGQHFFQLADDLLDLTADASQMGKATGKDAAAGKATLVALHGPNWARSQLHGLVAQAHALLEPYGDDAQLLKEAATFVATRTS